MKVEKKSEIGDLCSLLLYLCICITVTLVFPTLFVGQRRGGGGGGGTLFLRGECTFLRRRRFPNSLQSLACVLP